MKKNIAVESIELQQLIYLEEVELIIIENTVVV